MTTTTQIAPGLSVDEIYQIVGSLGIAHVIAEKGVTEVECLGRGEMAFVMLLALILGVVFADRLATHLFGDGTSKKKELPPRGE